MAYRTWQFVLIVAAHWDSSYLIVLLALLTPALLGLFELRLYFPVNNCSVMSWVEPVIPNEDKCLA